MAIYAVKRSNPKCRLNKCRGDTTPIVQRMPLTVADVMTRNVVTVSSGHTLTEVASVMANHSFRHYLVVEATRRLVGVISNLDVLRALGRKENGNTIHAHELMSADVIPVTPDTELSFATAMMLSEGINCLPVVDDRGNVCGILTSTDLLGNRHAMQERLEKENALVRSIAENLIAAGVTLVDRLKG